jgi:hypothetical protein
MQWMPTASIALSASMTARSWGRPREHRPTAFSNQIPAHTYQLRLFSNNTYTRLATSSNFTVAVPNVPLSASPTATTPGATITATWNAIPAPTPTDWVGLYGPRRAALAFYRLGLHQRIGKR